MILKLNAMSKVAMKNVEVLSILAAHILYVKNHNSLCTLIYKDLKNATVDKIYYKNEIPTALEMKDCIIVEESNKQYLENKEEYIKKYFTLYKDGLKKLIREPEEVFNELSEYASQQLSRLAGTNYNYVLNKVVSKYIEIIKQITIEHYFKIIETENKEGLIPVIAHPRNIIYTPEEMIERCNKSKMLISAFNYCDDIYVVTKIKDDYKLLRNLISALYLKIDLFNYIYKLHIHETYFYLEYIGNKNNAISYYDYMRDMHDLLGTKIRSLVG